MLEKYHKLQPKPEMIDGLKVALQTIWEVLPQDHIDKVVANLTATWLPMQLPMKATSSIYSKGLSISKSASSSHHQNKGLFSEPPTYYQSTTFKMLKTRNKFFEGSAAALCK